MAHRLAFFLLAFAAVLVPSLPATAKPKPDDGIKVVLVRHGEKPEDGDNLSCQGENRALQLPAVLYRKFSKPDYVHVPSLGMGKATKHARMFQTVSPFAIKYNLELNSQFDEKDSRDVADDVMKKSARSCWYGSTAPFPT